MIFLNITQKPEINIIGTLEVRQNPKLIKRITHYKNQVTCCRKQKIFFEISVLTNLVGRRLAGKFVIWHLS
jgi:hypothetical protein